MKEVTESNSFKKDFIGGFIPVKFLDEKVRRHKWNFVWQSLIAGIYMFFVVLVLDHFAETEILRVIGYTSIGSSAFLAFALHQSPVTGARRMIGGYAISITMGILCLVLAHGLNHFHVPMLNYHGLVICSALAIAGAMFFMAIMDMAHPPAAGLAVGLVLEQWSGPILIIIMLAVIVLALLKILLRKKMVNLM